MHIQYRHLKWLSLIWDTKLSSKAKLTAAVLADHMNSNHDIAWPSQNRIMAMASLSKSSVIRGTDELEEAGWLLIEQGGINKGTNRYQPIFPAEIEALIVSQRHLTGVTETPAGVTETPVLVSQRHPNQPIESAHKNTIYTESPIRSETDKSVVTRGNGCPYEKITRLWAEVLPELPQPVKLTAARKSRIKARWSDELPDLDSWRECFTHIKASKFLTGRVDPPLGRKRFVCTLDWITKQENLLKLYEGKYDNA